MALPGSGQITLKQIGTEFGTSPTLKSNYGKGGASASGDITIKEFYGRANRTDMKYAYYGSQWNSSGVGYSIDQHARSAIDEANTGFRIIQDSGFSINWAGVYTTAGGDDFFGFDWESGLATELGYWNECIVTWGVGGITSNYGRYDWYDTNVAGYDFVVLDNLYPSSVTDSSGWTLYEYVANGWGFDVQFDNRL